MTQTTQGNFKKKLLALAVLAPAMAITACSNDGAYIPGPELGSKDGNVQDGYLRGAVVCVDLNQNKDCDADEKQVDSVAKGAWTLEGLTPRQQRFPLVAKAIAGKTIDEDAPDAPIAEGFSYTAPASAKVISVLSTIVQTDIESRIAAGETPAAAEEAAKDKLVADLGIPADIDLTSFDPVEESGNSGINRDVAVQLRVINQVATKQLIQAVKSAPAGSNAAAVAAAATKNVAAKVADTKTVVAEKIAATGQGVADLDVAELVSIAQQSAEDTRTEVAVVTAEAVAAAEAEIEKAKEVIEETIEQEEPELPEDTVEPEEPGTGATGGSDGGTQGAA